MDSAKDIDEIVLKSNKIIKLSKVLENLKQLKYSINKKYAYINSLGVNFTEEYPTSVETYTVSLNSDGLCSKVAKLFKKEISKEISSIENEILLITKEL